MVLGVVMSSTHSSSLLTKGELRWESREEEEEPRRGEECEIEREGREGVGGNPLFPSRYQDTSKIEMIPSNKKMFIESLLHVKSLILVKHVI
jgi:hypothetical protein